MGFHLGDELKISLWDYYFTASTATLFIVSCIIRYNNNNSRIQTVISVIAVVYLHTVLN